jgi:hypothetical protein
VLTFYDQPFSLFERFGGEQLLVAIRIGELSKWQFLRFYSDGFERYASPVKEDE